MSSRKATPGSAQDGRLLVVLCGNDGRKPLVERLMKQAQLAVLVNKGALKNSSWCIPVVGKDNFIVYDETTGNPYTSAREAVESWGGKIAGIFTWDEFGVELCGFLVSHFSVPGTPFETTQICRDKHSFRKRMAECGVAGPKCCALRTEVDLQAVLSDPGWTFPCVLKPVKGAGSWHVLKLKSGDELRGVWEQFRKDLTDGSFPKEIKEAGFLLEEYFAGDEVDVDGWAENGALKFVIVSDNKPALEPNFLELGGTYPSQLPEEKLVTLRKLTADVVNALPGLHGAFHFEAKINEHNRAIPLEMNLRCGGAECPLSVEAVTGYYLPEVAVAIALGERIPRGEARYKIVESTNLFELEKVGVITECHAREVDREANKVVSLTLFDRNVGYRTGSRNGSNSCLGWISNGGATLAEAKKLLEKTINEVVITVDEDWRTKCN